MGHLVLQWKLEEPGISLARTGGILSAGGGQSPW